MRAFEAIGGIGLPEGPHWFDGFSECWFADRASFERNLADPAWHRLDEDAAIGWDDLVRIGALMGKAQPFVTLPGWSPGGLTDSEGLKARFAPPAEQLSLF